MKLKIAAVILFFSLGFLLRLYRLNSPVADWHSFRQSDTAAVARIFVEEGYDLLYPRYFDISNVQSGIDNPNGYRFVEFPIYNFLHSFFYKNIGVLSFTEWGRMLSIISSLVTAVIIYLLVKKYIDKKTGIAAAGVFLFLPFSIYYSRTILPDTMMVTSIMLGIYFFDKWLESIKYKVLSIKYLVPFFLALFFTSLSLLLKPFALFFVFPFIYLAYDRFGFKMLFKWQLYFFAIAAVVPFTLWRNWISQFPEGIPASSWLFNGNGIRFRPSFFRWIFFERLTKLILGYSGIIFLSLGFFKTFKIKRASGLFLSFAASSLIYVSVIATGNVQHDYYQILVIPTISIFTGIGIVELFKIVSSKINTASGFLVCSVIIMSSFYFSWYLVRDYFNINDRGMVMAGERADMILPKDALVIAPHDGSTTLLNITGRRGWPVFQNSIEELIERGANYMVIANPTESDFNGFGKTYEVVDSSDKYLILKLR